jgi:hypothetical protein
MLTADGLDVALTADTEISGDRALAERWRVKQAHG